jgi:L,D-peptidoglycan transpeptidase YkuD (ErfK/YbiS/YcfS/YnhG family)
MRKSCYFDNKEKATMANVIVQGDKLMLAEQVFRCALGRGGVKSEEDKREGDGCTPAGTYPIRCVYYRADRLAKPVCQLPMQELKPTDGWCDEPSHPQYNRFVSLPFLASHEELWRSNHLYDVIVEIGHNDDPVVPHMGSAIFMHLASDTYSPTAGCIALALTDLLFVLSQLTKESTITVKSKSS